MRNLRFCCALLLLAAPAAFAQATRTWISGVGDDLNPCSRTAPCLTLSGALAKTAVGGEIDVLDPMALGAATLTSSITIAATSQFGGAMDAPSLTGLTIDAPGAVITVRGLTFEANQSGTSGLRVLDAAVLRLEGCRFNGFTADGIDARVSDGGLLFLDDVAVRGSLGAGLASSSTGMPLRVVVSGSSFVGNARGLWAGPGAQVTLVDGVVAGNVGAGLFAVSDGGAVEINVERSQLTRNGLGAEALAGAVIRLSNANVTENGAGPTHVTGAGRVHSFGNNRILGGSTPACVAGSVTLDPVTLPAGVVGTAFAPVMLGSGGPLGSVSYAATGTVPAGVGFDAGVFAGIPQQTGTFPVTLTATDFNGCVGSQAATLVISCPAVSVAPSALPTITTGAPMTPVSFALAGSTATQTQFILTGALPIGLTFAGGVLSGMPTQGGSYPLVISAMDSFGCSAQASLTLEVVLAPGYQATTLAVTALQNPIPVTVPLTLTATLAFGTGTPGGTVTFSEGATLLGTVPLVSGFAVFTTATLPLSTHRLAATYSGDATFGASVAPELAVEVVLVPTEISLSAFGTRLDVEVTSAVAIPVGTVEVVVDGAAPVTLTLDADGRARLAGPITVGTHVARASYVGSVRFAPSQSMEASYTVNEPVADAGTPVAEVDAGAMQPTTPTGCGCTSADAGLSLFGLLALAWRRGRALKHP